MNGTPVLDHTIYIYGSDSVIDTMFSLLSGETFKSLSFQFRIGERTVSAIVEETCEALYNAMKEQFLKVLIANFITEIYTVTVKLIC